MLRFLVNASVGRRAGVRAALPAALTALLAPAGAAEAKGPGQTYCFYKTCHRVKTLAETRALVGQDIKVVASHYDSCKRDRFNPCGLTSSGEAFHSDRPDNAASPVLPDGTIALVWSKSTKEAIVIRINNAGPYWGNRKLDLSKAAARKLGIAGVGEVTLRVLKAPTPEEARYRKNRVYEPVPGPIGQFANLDSAHSAMSIMVALGKPGTTALAGLAPVAAPAETPFDVASAYKTPLLPGFDLPRAGLAAALAAQAEAERQLRTASLPPSTAIAQTREAALDARPVAAPQSVPPVGSLKALQAEPLSKKTIRTAEVGQAVTPAPAAVAFKKPTVRAAKDKETAAPRLAKAAQQPRRAPSRASTPKPLVQPTVATASAPKSGATPKALRAPRVAGPTPSSEIHVGFTTYAEKRYQTKVASVAAKPKKKPAKVIAQKPAKQAPSAVAAGAAPASPVKRAAASKAGKSAALKKAGGWQSSAVMAPDMAPVIRPHLTGSHPSLPADEMNNEADTPQRPRLKVQPSSLV